MFIILFYTISHPVRYLYKEDIKNVEEELNPETLEALELEAKNFADRVTNEIFTNSNSLWSRKAQTFLLFNLNQSENGLHPGELASLLKVGSSRAAALIKDLESEGLIISSADPDDNRKKIVLITEKGKEIVYKDKKHMDKTISFLVERVGLDNLRSFFELARKVFDAMGEEKESFLTKETTINV